MTLASILLFSPAETADPAKGAAPYAIGLAQALDAQLTALVFTLDVTSPRELQASGGPDAAAVVGQAAQNAGVPTVLITEHSRAKGIHEVVADHAKLHDLVVTGAAEHGLLSERAVAEYLLFQSGRPVLVVPERATGFACKRVAVAWDGSPAAARALGDAVPLLQRAEEVVLLTVPDDKELASSLSLAEVVAALGRREIRVRGVEARRGDRSIGDALSQEAVGLGCDLLVMGAYGQPKWREIVLGGATREILQEPRLPTLLSH